MTILLYAVKVLLASGLLYGYYALFLRNRPFHRYNRVYLLLATALSFVVPLIVIPLSLSSFSEKGIGLARTLQVIVPGEWVEQEGAGPAVTAGVSRLTLSGYAGLLYGIGILAGIFFLLQSLRYIAIIRKKYSFTRLCGVRLYDTTEPGTPFSFFTQIFWNRQIPTDTPEGQQILRHELYHVRQRHSADLIFMELCCCLGWLNPFFRLFKRELTTIHEFLADEYAALPDKRLEYAELLVQHAILQKTTGPGHPFSRYEIKRRIGMITRSRQLSGAGGLCSRILAGPLLLLLFSAFAFKQVAPAAGSSPGTRIKGGPVAQPLTVVIDAGHGGSDAGAVRGGLAEKNITLALAEKINELAEQYPGVQVVLTRNSDELPGGVTDKKEGLRKRTEIAREHKADLFISLHVNNSGAEGTPPQGVDAYVSARRTDKESVSLAGALLQQMSTLYITSSAVKRRETGIYVLDASPCPAVILECGNLSWQQDRTFITDKDNQEKIARKILEGITQYWQSGR